MGAARVQVFRSKHRGDAAAESAKLLQQAMPLIVHVRDQVRVAHSPARRVSFSCHGVPT